ncbi:hypothetical protein I4U23_011529 [Adineta vaga]|nr:hypothetical protein I4U23_011529 [Adineta vaga]
MVHQDSSSFINQISIQTSMKLKCNKCKQDGVTIAGQHRQVMNEELDEIVNGYNQFQQTIDDKKQSSDYIWINTQIHLWETAQNC